MVACFRIILEGQTVERRYAEGYSSEEMRQWLINHAGYPKSVVVRRENKSSKRIGK